VQKNYRRLLPPKKIPAGKQAIGDTAFMIQYINYQVKIQFWDLIHKTIHGTAQRNVSGGMGFA
jgi:hypothetical protein